MNFNLYYNVGLVAMVISNKLKKKKGVSQAPAARQILRYSVFCILTLFVMVAG